MYSTLSIPTSSLSSSLYPPSIPPSILDGEVVGLGGVVPVQSGHCQREGAGDAEDSGIPDGLLPIGPRLCAFPGPSLTADLS